MKKKDSKKYNCLKPYPKLSAIDEDKAEADFHGGASPDGRSEGTNGPDFHGWPGTGEDQNNGEDSTNQEEKADMDAVPDADPGGLEEEMSRDSSDSGSEGEGGPRESDHPREDRVRYELEPAGPPYDDGRDEDGQEVRGQRLRTGRTRCSPTHQSPTILQVGY